MRHINGLVVSTSYTSARSCASACAATDGGSAANFYFRSRLGYTFPFRSKKLRDFVYVEGNCVISLAYTYKNDQSDVTVTLIPLRHFAHPEFFHQVDNLCCQHQSVLMEGRTPYTSAPYSTFVPPRERVASVRPAEYEDSEGWEPREVERFWQPFSWGVKDSLNMTVVHAADKYDYEKLPWWSSVRFNAPLLGNFSREKHCLSMIPGLRASGYKSFAVPWGAAHMPIFNEMLVDNGMKGRRRPLLAAQHLDSRESKVTRKTGIGAMTIWARS